MVCFQEMTALQLEVSFPDEQACKTYLANHRWHNKIRCPRCGNDRVYELAEFNWQCQACNPKGYRFSVLVGTIFENTKIPLNKWFRVIHLMLTSSGVTIVQVQRNIGLSNRSAWFLCQRVRTALADDSFREFMGIVVSNAHGASAVFNACPIPTKEISHAADSTTELERGYQPLDRYPLQRRRQERRT
jgi:transposase-like protein